MHVWSTRWRGPVQESSCVVNTLLVIVNSAVLYSERGNFQVRGHGKTNCRLKKCPGTVQVWVVGICMQKMRRGQTINVIDSPLPIFVLNFMQNISSYVYSFEFLYFTNNYSTASSWQVIEKPTVELYLESNFFIFIVTSADIKVF